MSNLKKILVFKPIRNQMLIYSLTTGSCETGSFSSNYGKRANTEECLMSSKERYKVKLTPVLFLWIIYCRFSSQCICIYPAPHICKQGPAIGFVCLLLLSSSSVIKNLTGNLETITFSKREVRNEKIDKRVYLIVTKKVKSPYVQLFLSQIHHFNTVKNSNTTEAAHTQCLDTCSYCMEYMYKSIRVNYYDNQTHPQLGYGNAQAQYMPFQF